MTKQKFALAMVALSLSCLLQADTITNEVVLATPDFNVTTKDFYYYSLSNIPAEQRERVLAQEGAVKEIYENLYVIRAFAEKAKNNDELDMEEIEWMTTHYKERLLMGRQLANEVAEMMDEIDWDAAAMEEYTANPDKYQVAEQVSAAHILISTEKRSEEEALETAKEVLEKLMAGGDFAVLAEEYSDDPSAAQNKGELGFFGRKKMVKEFEDAAFAMREPGELSEPVKTRFGYHIIRLNEYKDAELRPFESVKTRIINVLKKQKLDTFRAEKINAIKSAAESTGLQVNTRLIEETEARYSAD